MTSTRAGIRKLALLGVLVALAVGLFVPTGGAIAPETANESVNGSANETVEMSVWTAPAARFDSFHTPRDVHAAMANGTLTRNRTVADEDTLVFAVESPSAVESLRRERNATRNDTAAFVDLVEGSPAVEFELRQINMQANMQPPRLNLTDTVAADGLRVVSDDRNGTLYLVLKTDRARLAQWGTGPGERPLRPNTEYETTVGVNHSAASDRVEWGVVERTLEFEEPVHGDRLVFGVNAPCHRLAGRASVAPGTELAIRMDPSGDYRPLETTAVVDPDGTFETALDTSEPYPSNASVNVTVSGVQPDVTEGVFGNDAGPVGLTSVRVDDQQSNGSVVVVESTTIGTGKGGFVALYPASVAGDIATKQGSSGCGLTQIDRSLASEHLLGVSEYLVPGEHETVSVRLDSTLDGNRTLVAVPHLDTNENESFDFPVSDSDQRQSVLVTTDGPASLNGSLVMSRASVTVETPGSNRTTPNTVVPPPTTASPGSRTPTDSTATDTQANTTTETTAGAGPGFTAGIVVAVLLSVALLVRRHS